MANGRRCVLCGNVYSYCPSCTKDRFKPTWYKLFDSENCHNIFGAINDYKFKLVTKEQAQEVLRGCDLSIKLNDHYRGELNEIMTNPEEVVEIQEEEKVVEEVVEVKPASKRKSKSQHKVEKEEVEVLSEVVVEE